MPEAVPLRPGKCDHAAAKGAEYIKPLPKPSPRPYKYMNKVGDLRNEQISTVESETKPPIRSTLKILG